MKNSKFIFLIILIGLISSLAGLYFGKNTSSFNQELKLKSFSMQKLRLLIIIVLPFLNIKTNGY